MAENKSTERKKSKIKIGPIPLLLPAAETASDKADVASVLLFEIGGRSFAIGVENTEGVVDCPRISPLPSPPEGLEGVASVRGRMTLVMDLSLKANPAIGKWRLILIKGETQLGLLAERVEGVFALDKDAPPRDGKTSAARKGDEDSYWPTRYYFTVENRRVPLIDVERLIEI
ncbi:MAG TPA: chemotaxis protein CheW [Blastocatellia bacterium]|nr:chemotaxis protein CheW [Blastocatellia bacterium]